MARANEACALFLLYKFRIAFWAGRTGKNFVFISALLTVSYGDLLRLRVLTRFSISAAIPSVPLTCLFSISSEKNKPLAGKARADGRMRPSLREWGRLCVSWKGLHAAVTPTIS